MRKIFFLFILISSCQNPASTKTPIVIVGKLYTYGLSSDKCICQFQYAGFGYTNAVSFEDSCAKYNIGDTIKPKSKP